LINNILARFGFDGHMKVVLITFLIQIFSAVLGFGLQIIIARNISTELYGELGILINYGTTLSYFVLFGVNTYVLRKVSTLDVEKDKKEISKLYLDSWIFLVFNCLLTFSGLFLVHVFFPFSIFEVNLFNALIFIGFTLSLASIFFIQNMDRALGYTIRSIAPVSIFKSVLILLPLGVLLYWNVELNLFLLFSLYVISSIVLLGYYLFKQVPLLEYNLGNLKAGYKHLFQKSKDYFVNRVSHNFLKSLDLIFIDLLLTSFDAGIFSAALRIRIIIMFGLNALNIVFSPDVARLYKNGEIEELNRILKKANIFIFGFGLTFLVLILFFSKPILSFFGSDYVSGSLVLVLICSANLVEASFGMTGSILNMTGRQKYYNRVIFFLLFLYVISAPFFLGTWGLVGSAVLIIIITLVKNFLEWQYIYFKLKIKTGVISNLLSLG